MESGASWALLTSPVKLVVKTDTKKANILRLFTVLVCLVGAIGSYLLGSSTGIVVFIIIGVFLEIALMFKLTEASRPSHQDT